MLLHCIILVDFSSRWSLAIRSLRTKVPGWMQILGWILSERSEGSSAEPSTSCSASGVHLHFGDPLLYAVNVCVLGPPSPSMAGRLSRTQGT